MKKCYACGSAKIREALGDGPLLEICQVCSYRNPVISSVDKCPSPQGGFEIEGALQLALPLEDIGQ